MTIVRSLYLSISVELLSTSLSYWPSLIDNGIVLKIVSRGLVIIKLNVHVATCTSLIAS